MMKKTIVVSISILISAAILALGISALSNNNLSKAIYLNIGFAEYKPVPNCRLEVSDAYIDTRSRGFADEEYVAFDVSSSCNHIQENVQIDLEIWEKGKFFNHKKATFHTNPRAASSTGFLVRASDFGVLCRNADLTSYFALASATATIDGKRKETVQVMSMSPVTLKCGL